MNYYNGTTREVCSSTPLQRTNVPWKSMVCSDVASWKTKTISPFPKSQTWGDDFQKTSRLVGYVFSFPGGYFLSSCRPLKRGCIRSFSVGCNSPCFQWVGSPTIYKPFFWKESHNRILRGRSNDHHVFMCWKKPLNRPSWDDFAGKVE